MSLWTWFAGVDSTSQSAGDAETEYFLNDALRKYQSGEWTLEQYQTTVSRLQSNLADNSPAGVSGQINTAAIEGAKQGLKDLGANIQIGTDWSFKALWSLIPWQVKVIIIVVLLLKLFNLFGGIDAIVKTKTKL